MSASLLRRIAKPRRVAYWLGFRPRTGAVWHSPTLAFRYAWMDAQRGGGRRG